MMYLRSIAILLLLLAGVAQSMLAAPGVQGDSRNGRRGAIMTTVHHAPAQVCETAECETDIEPDLTLEIVTSDDRDTMALLTRQSATETPAPDPERPIFLVVHSFLI